MTRRIEKVWLEKGEKLWKLWIRDEYGCETSTGFARPLLCESQAELILAPLLTHQEGYRKASIETKNLHIKESFSAMDHLGVKELPTDTAGWDLLVRGLHLRIITRPDSAAKLEGRLGKWQTIKNWLVILQDEGIIPVAVIIPNADRSRLRLREPFGGEHKLLGEKAAKPVTETFITKTIVPISLARSNAEYLTEIFDLLTSRRRVLFNCLVDYWSRLRDNYRFGLKLSETVDWDALKIQLGTIAQANPDDPDWGSICNLNTREGLVNTVIVFRNIYGDVHAVTALSKIPARNRFIPPAIFGSGSPKLLKNRIPDLPPNFSGVISVGDRLAVKWMVGEITNWDVGIICALLIMLNPQLTPQSIINARLVDSKGKRQIYAGDLGINFSVEKPRAVAYKKPQLCDLSTEILTTVVEMTERRRKALEAVGDPRANLLFLASTLRADYDTANLKSTGIEKFLEGTKNPQQTSLYHLYPELEKAGLPRGTVSLSRIRHTEGLLAWFRTGSVREVSRVLGNTTRVVIEHYIPPALLRAWNTRLVRRFQNLWIALAAAKEDWLLDVLDFSTIDELHDFLCNMLVDHPKGTSQFADTMHARLGDGKHVVRDQIATLHVKIEPHALASLYIYRRSALSAGLTMNEMARPAGTTRVAPVKLVDLADMLLAALPDHRDPEFRRAHTKALQLAEDRFPHVNWTQLIAAQGHP